MQIKKIVLLTVVSLQLFSSSHGMVDTMKKRNKREEAMEERQVVDQEIFAGINAARQGPVCDPCTAISLAIVGFTMAAYYVGHEHIIGFFFPHHEKPE